MSIHINHKMPSAAKANCGASQQNYSVLPVGRKIRNVDGGESCEERKELALDDQELKDTGQQGEDSGR